MSDTQIEYRRIEGRSTPFYQMLLVLTVMAVAGVVATWILWSEGLHLSGMTNRIPWGVQITMAVFYIGLSAGSLVVSGLYGVFGRIEYKPFARLAAYIAMLFLIAGLLSILTDQGRMDRVFVEPFTHFNVRSMFSINPGLYMGHIVLCVVYLWALFREKKLLTRVAAVVVVLWAITVHTGTGMILGFIPRELHQSPLLPPSFVAAALASGTALMIIVLVTLFRLTRRHLDDALIVWLGRLLAISLVVVFYFMFIESAYRYYLIESREAARFYLFGGFHSVLLWGGLMIVGCLIPSVILFHPRLGRTIPWIVFAAAMVVFGVLCERYVIVIPGQTNPPELFPGMVITTSPLDEGFVSYSISSYEALQAVGVLGIVGLLFVLGLKYLALAPVEARLPRGAGS
ncbi:MAG: NrfD/PsrC family molybdoenzyme membrane anchor subunit [Planctomycetota bacterium]